MIEHTSHFVREFSDAELVIALDYPENYSKVTYRRLHAEYRSRLSHRSGKVGR